MSRWPLRPVALAVMILMPLAATLSGEGRLVPLLVMPLVVLGAPLIIAARGGGSDPDAGSDDGGSDDGPGGNRRPDRGPTTPSGPTGELPLDHSRPARWRQRGNGPQHTDDPGRRRSPHRPTRTPHRVPSRPAH